VFCGGVLVIADCLRRAGQADATWVEFIARVWPVAHRYRVLLALLSQVAYGVVFAIADSDPSNGTLGARAATITSLLMLGVPEMRAIALVGDQP
jgi:hypothetical protein